MSRTRAAQIRFIDPVGEQQIERGAEKRSPESNTEPKSHYPPGNHHLATSKNVLFPGHNHLLTIGTDDPSLAGMGDNQSVGSSVPVVSR